MAAEGWHAVDGHTDAPSDVGADAEVTPPRPQQHGAHGPVRATASMAAVKATGVSTSSTLARSGRLGVMKAMPSRRSRMMGSDMGRVRRGAPGA
jgi:hypothetical protein